MISSLVNLIAVELNNKNLTHVDYNHIVMYKFKLKILGNEHLQSLKLS